MKFGLILPNFGAIAGADAIRKSAVLAEDLGLDSVWTTDHVLMPADMPDPYGNLVESLIALTAAAALQCMQTLHRGNTMDDQLHEDIMHILTFTIAHGDPDDRHRATATLTKYMDDKTPRDQTLFHDDQLRSGILHALNFATRHSDDDTPTTAAPRKSKYPPKKKSQPWRRPRKKRPESSHGAPSNNADGVLGCIAIVIAIFIILSLQGAHIRHQVESMVQTFYVDQTDD